MGFDSQARDPVCMASHAPEEAPALNSTGPGGREAPLMELVLTARAVEDAPWAAVAGLRPFLVLHQEGALRLCVGVGGDYPRLEELRGRFSAAVQARKQRVQEWAQASGAQREQTAPGPATPAGLPAPASPFSDSTDDDDHAALAELALTMERLACDPRAPRRRFVFDLDCSGAVGRIGAGDEEGDPPTGAELEAALARLDEEPEADDEDADAESDQGRPLSPEELLRRRSDVHLARIASSGAAAPRGRRRQAHRGVTAFLKHQSTERQRLETRAAAAGAARPADGDAAAAPSPSPSPPSPPSGAEGEGGDPLGPSPADGRCRRLNPAAERYVLLPCGGAGSVTNILPALPWPFAGEVVSDAWDGATVAVRAFGRLGLSFALADVSDALERGTDPGDVVSLLYAEGALTDSAADADDLRSESAEPDSARRGASGGPTAASEAATASSSAVVGPGAGDGPDHRRRVSLGDGAPHKSEAFVRSAAAANGGGDGRPRSGGGGDGGGESGTESGSFGYEAATAALLSCPSSCPNNAGFANRVATALPTSEFPLVSAAPAFSDRWLGMEGQLLALPDVGFYSPLRSHGFVDVGRVAAECSSLEAGSVKALIRARMNGLVLLQHDLEDLTTYSLLGQELERAGVPGPRQPRDAEPSMALGWGALLNATPTSLRVSTSLTAGDFLLSAQTSPLLDPAQWRRAAATLSPSRANAKLGGFGAASAAGAGPAARAADAAAAAAMSLLPGASRLAMRRSALAELDLFGQARGWSAALCFTRQWGRRLLSAAAAGATGVVASGPWSPAATWPSSAGRGPGDAPGPSLLRNVSAAARGSASSDVAWAGRWSDMDPFQPSAANGFASVVASANMRLLRDLSMALPMSDAPLSPPSALSQVDVDALVVASARRAAAAAAGACNADAGAALLLASEAAWESMESAGGSAGSGAARSYFALRWAMLPNTNEQAWAALVRTPWKDLVQATGRGAQASRRLGAAADAVDPSCGRAFSASREDGARALIRSAAVTQLYQGTWACLLEASWWLRTARVVAMAQGEDALSSQLPLPQGLGGRAADGEEGDDGSADAPDEEEDAVGSCLTWPWPRGMAEARVPEERLQLPSQEARTGGVGSQGQRHRPTDRACAEASRLLSAARAAVGHWRKRFPELGRRWQITGPDPDLDARPLFWRDTEPMSPRSVAELLNGPLRWRWQALCRKASAETGRA
ncbi:hypothetical protein FNF27_03889 [Cafeteria roenbergensis]|uniref:Uncharacterized protein n=1 Tax=Cafeteria roenbergensis TaxID=33653 RepID=A0A5A8E9Q7_CAFRO|nr:hypothetical protein FNF27_03889 [Cafeteria roenbergensis]